MTISPTFVNPYSSTAYTMPAQNVPQIYSDRGYAPTSYGKPIQNTAQLAACTALQQTQSAANVGPNTQGKPDLVCNALYDAQDKTVHLSSFERGWLDSNIWHTINADGSGETISAWGEASQYPAGTFSRVFNKAQKIYYTQGKISEDTALDLVTNVRAAADVARQNGMETSYRIHF